MLSGLLAAALVSGCATLAGPPPLTRDDIVRLSKAGESPQAIIDRLQATDTVIPLTGSDIVRLHQQGVPEEVLDYLQQAQIAEMRRREAMLYSMYPYPAYTPFYGCGLRRFHPYAWDPWGWC